MKCLVLGASAGLGRAVSEELATQGHQLLLVASDERDLLPLASDLKLRFGIQIRTLALDLTSDTCSFKIMSEVRMMAGLDRIYAVAGYSDPVRDPMELSTAEIDKIVRVNFTSLVQIIQSCLPILALSSTPRLIGIGSVAASRARGKNTIYASAKRALEFYFSGLRHQLASGPHRVQFYRMGFLDTQMNVGDGPFPAATPAAVARAIIRDADRDFGMRYIPGWWFWIMFIYQSVPWFVYKRMKA